MLQGKTRTDKLSASHARSHWLNAQAEELPLPDWYASDSHGG